MGGWEEVRHQVAIAGRVTDEQTGRPFGQARVEISAGPAAFTGPLALKALQYGDRWATLPERPDRTHTAADGHFHFLDLPGGQYTLTAFLPRAGSRYGQVQKQVTIARTAAGNLKVTVADLALSPTTLKGRVTLTEQGQVKVVALAEVRVQGSGERTFSDSQGNYILTELEASAQQDRFIQISAQGYKSAVQKIRLNQAGAVQTLNFSLTRATA